MARRPAADAGFGSAGSATAGAIATGALSSRTIGTWRRCSGIWNMRDIMKWYREFITRAPEEMNGFFAMLGVPPGPPFPQELHLRNMCGIGDTMSCFICWRHTAKP